MTVHRIPFEPTRFFVSSESRAGVDHVVDMAWQDEKWHRPTAKCSCEEMQAKHKQFCKHLFAVVDYLKSHERDALEA